MIGNKSFGITIDNNGTKNLRFDSDQAIECCDFAIKENIKSIHLSTNWYKAKDLKPILPLKDYIEKIIFFDRIGIDDIYSFKNLSFLSIVGYKDNIIELDKFIRLESLCYTHSNNVYGLDKCLNLKLLTINDFKPKVQDLTSLPIYPKLKHLTLVKSNIKNLEGIDKFSLLEELNIWYCRKLETIKCLESLDKTLSKVEFESCKKIKDVEMLGKLKSLINLSISNCGEIQSLAFLKEIPKLETLKILNTLIVDGDLSFCEKLKSIAFDDKKYYTHKNQLDKATGLFKMEKNSNNGTLARINQDTANS